jgi:hypothetical protein
MLKKRPQSGRFSSRVKTRISSPVIARLAFGFGASGFQPATQAAAGVSLRSSCDESKNNNDGDDFRSD